MNAVKEVIKALNPKHKEDKINFQKNEIILPNLTGEHVSRVTQLRINSNGTVTSPSIVWINTLGGGDTGFYLTGADEISLAQAGTKRWTFLTGGQLLGASGSTIRNSSGSVGSPSFTFGDDTNTGIYNPNANELGISVSGALVASWKMSSSGGGWQLIPEADSHPGLALLTANDGIAFYNKGNKLVFAYNNSGTMTYLSIPLDGSSTTWTHSTVEP